MEHNSSRDDESMPEKYAHKQINMQLTISKLIKRHQENYTGY